MALGGLFALASAASLCLAGDRTCGALMPLGRDLDGVALRLDGVFALLLVAIPVDRTLVLPDLFSDAAGWIVEEAELRFVLVSPLALIVPFVGMSGFFTAKL